MKFEGKQDEVNLSAFLMVIRHCEGTASEDGYTYLFGSSPKNSLRFTDFSKHPNISRPFGRTYSTAAGAYQILYGTWVSLRKMMPTLLPDFSPRSQDIACTALIAGRKALQAVRDGNLKRALQLCSLEWASLPYSPYGQPIKTYEQCRQYFVKYGGVVNEG